MLYIIAIALMVAADRLLKLWMARLLAGGPIVLIPGVVQLHYIENRGMAFGLLSGRQTLLIIVTSLLMLLLVVLLFRTKSRLERISLVMIIAGGIGNLIDRVRDGFVVDYIEPLFVDFAIFNLADILVNVGCFLFVGAILVNDYRQAKLKKQRKADGADSPAALPADGGADAAAAVRPADNVSDVTGEPAPSAQPKDAADPAGRAR